MPKITDCFSRQIMQELRPPRNSVLISISDVGSQPPVFTHYKKWDEVLFLTFDDVTRGGGVEFPAVHHANAPTQKDTKAIYDFIVQHQEKNIFAHCEAGISRSGAIREFLDRMGWQVDHALQWMIHPNITILTDLERYQRELRLIQH